MYKSSVQVIIQAQTAGVTYRLRNISYTYDFGDYWQHQVRVEKLLPPTALAAHPVCVSGRRACPPEEVGGPNGYGQRTLDQFSWAYKAHDRLLAGEDIREDDVPTWFWTFRPEQCALLSRAANVPAATSHQWAPPPMTAGPV